VTKPRKKPSKKESAGGPPPAVDGISWASQAESESMEWVVRNMIPRNTTNIIEGRKASGKSTVLAAIAAAWTGGPEIPTWEGPRGGRVIWQASEDPWKTMVIPRLAAACANLDRIGRCEVQEGNGYSRSPKIPEEFEYLEKKIIESGANLVILDPLSSVVGPSADLCTERGCRAVMDTLNAICERRSVTMILVRHLKKNWRGDVREAGYGHGALGNAARGITRCDEHPQGLKERLWSVVACNWAEYYPTWNFSARVVSGSYKAIDWGGRSKLTAQEIAEGCGSLAEQDEYQDADLLLCARLMDGWVLRTEIGREAEAAGIRDSSLRGSKKRLGVRTRRTGFGSGGEWHWGPPEAGFDPILVDLVRRQGGGHNGTIYGAFDRKPAIQPAQIPEKPPKAPKALEILPPPPESQEDGHVQPEKTTS